jgi:hypothetical protein
VPNRAMKARSVILYTKWYSDLKTSSMRRILRIKLRELARGFKKRYGNMLKYDVEEEISRYKVSQTQFQMPHITDVHL